MPTIADIIDYEEGKTEILSKLKSGYPRFVMNPFVQRLFEDARKKFGKGNEWVMVFPDEQSSDECLQYVLKSKDIKGHTKPYGFAGLTAVIVPFEARSICLYFWRISGRIVSSRLAEKALGGLAGEDIGDQDKNTYKKIKERIATLAGTVPENVFLFESGMAAIYALHQSIQKISPGKTVQVEFPYVDTLLVLREFGNGVIELLKTDSGTLSGLATKLQNGDISSVWTETPSNPLLHTADTEAMAKLCRQSNVTLIIDDTIGTSFNLNVLQYADAVTTSLTKFFSGKGDVMAGAVTLNPSSPFYEKLQGALVTLPDNLWKDDAVVLEENTRDFEERMLIINNNAEVLFEFLKSHPKIGRVWYPKTESPEHYLKIKKAEGGFGGLMSMLLKNPVRATPKFYDSLDLAKGPSLGTNFTLVCPYTLLAHYHELSWAESAGIDRNLIRISVGLENVEDLIEKFKVALDSI